MKSTTAGRVDSHNNGPALTHFTTCSRRSYPTVRRMAGPEMAIGSPRGALTEWQPVQTQLQYSLRLMAGISPLSQAPAAGRGSTARVF